MVNFKPAATGGRDGGHGEAGDKEVSNSNITYLGSGLKVGVNCYAKKVTDNNTIVLLSEKRVAPKNTGRGSREPQSQKRDN